jgi:hypothetical protein
MMMGPKRPMAGMNGNWACPNCQNVNYSFRERCNRCQTAKPPTDDAAPPADINAAAAAGAAAATSGELAPAPDAGDELRFDSADLEGDDLGLGADPVAAGSDGAGTPV